MARDAKRDADGAAGTGDEGFRSGSLMAFHAVISLLQQQALAFQIPLADLDLADIEPMKELVSVAGCLTNRCRQRGMAGPVPLRGSRWLVPRA